MNITIDISEEKYQKLKESAKEWDMPVHMYVEHLIDQDQQLMYELSHDMGTSSFHDLWDAIHAMYLINDYYWQMPPDDCYANEACFVHTQREMGNIWERVADGQCYINGNYGIAMYRDGKLV